MYVFCKMLLANYLMSHGAELALRALRAPLDVLPNKFRHGVNDGYTCDLHAFM